MMISNDHNGTANRLVVLHSHVMQCPSGISHGSGAQVQCLGGKVRNAGE
jgi:hypothetical protein